METDIVTEEVELTNESHNSFAVTVTDIGEQLTLTSNCPREGDEWKWDYETSTGDTPTMVFGWDTTAMGVDLHVRFHFTKRQDLPR